MHVLSLLALQELYLHKCAKTKHAELDELLAH